MKIDTNKIIETLLIMTGIGKVVMMMLGTVIMAATVRIIEEEVEDVVEVVFVAATINIILILDINNEVIDEFFIFVFFGDNQKEIFH